MKKTRIRIRWAPAAIQILLRQENFLVSRDEIVTRGDAPGLPAIVERKTRPDCYVPTFFILIPTSATARLPDCRLQPFLDLSVEGRLDVVFHVDRFQTLSPHEAETTHDVCDLRLNHNDHRLVAETGMGPSSMKKFGNPLTQMP